MTRRDDLAGAQTIGAVILFGLFVTVIAVLNVTAVPDAGRAAEDAHHARALDVLGGLQAEAEGAPEGATASRVLPLAPERDAGGGFLSFFLAKPAQATGQVTFEAGYGNVTLSHTRTGTPGRIHDAGGESVRLPLGRVTFDPHALFREPEVARLEGGALVVATPASERIAHAPAITLSVEGGVTDVAVNMRLLTGEAADVGGAAGVRLALTTEALTRTAPHAPNADQAVLRLETAHGRAWGAFLNETATEGGLAAGRFTTSVLRGAGQGGLDIVTWTVNGTGSGNDVRLTTGVTLQRARLG